MDYELDVADTLAPGLYRMRVRLKRAGADVAKPQLFADLFEVQVQP